MVKISRLLDLSMKRLSAIELSILHGCKIESRTLCGRHIKITVDGGNIFLTNCKIEDNVHFTIQGEGYGKISVGDKTIVRPYCFFDSWDGAKISIGAHNWVNMFTRITSRNLVKIGSYCFIGEGVSIHDYNHLYSNAKITIKEQGMEDKEVIIGDDCMIGAKVTIVAGVRIEDGAVIGANAVVTRDIPKNAIAMGIPAEIVGYRGEG